MAAQSEDTKRWWVLGAMGGVLSLIVLDQTVVGVALPTIQKDLSLTTIEAHWVINAYFFVIAVGVAIGGRLADVFGRMRLFHIGLICFGVASAGCGLAFDETTIIAARLLQGFGAALIFPCCMAIIANTFAPEQRGLAYGIQTATGGTAMALGPFVGGAFSELITWRAIFWINIPIVLVIAAIVIITGAKTGDDARPEKGSDASYLDAKGMALFTFGMGAFVFAVMQVPEWGYSLSLPFLVIGILLVWWFIKDGLGNPRAFLEVDLFKSRSFTALNLMVFGGQMINIAFTVFLPLYMQQVLKLSPLMTGIAMLPAVIHLSLTSLWCGTLADKYSARRLSLTALAVGCGAAAAIALGTQLGTYWVLVLPMFVWGFTLPFYYVPVRRAITTAVDPSKHGQASGICQAMQLLGGTIYTSFASTILAQTNSYGALFLSTCIIPIVIILLGLRWIPKTEQATS
ncbi:MFS transporter [Pseudovibrio flavus]|uniref:MFS transporter n=1 Tax=Pseudovibrio flavus TaxID=2529854 RepID=UPI00211D0E81|nr:MFS transporter [Pseudovibrio flavus]